MKKSSHQLFRTACLIGPTLLLVLSSIIHEIIRFQSDPFEHTLKLSGYAKFIFFLSSNQTSSAPVVGTGRIHSSDVALAGFRYFGFFTNVITSTTCIMVLLAHVWSLRDIVDSHMITPWIAQIDTGSGAPRLFSGHSLCKIVQNVNTFAELINTAIRWQMAILIAEGAFYYPIRLAQILMPEEESISRFFYVVYFFCFSTVLIMAANIKIQVNQFLIQVMDKTHTCGLQKDDMCIMFVSNIVNNIAIKAGGRYSVDFSLLGNVRTVKSKLLPKITFTYVFLVSFQIFVFLITIYVICSGASRVYDV